MSLDLPILGYNTMTQGGPHVPPPEPPHLFTYKQPVFAANAASFYGLVIPVSIGRRAIVGVPVWSSPFKVDTVTTPGSPAGANSKKKKKKKLIAAASSSTTASLGGALPFVTVDFAVSLGYAGAAAEDIVNSQVLRLWANGTLIYDATAQTGWNTAAGLRFKVYKGAPDQTADPILVSWLGEDEAIAFRDELYIMFYDFPLTTYGFDSIPFIRAEVRDSYSVAANVVDFTRLTTSTGPCDPKPLAVDWTRQRMCGLSNAYTILHTYDLTNNIEIANPTLTGAVYGGFNAIYLDPFYGYLISNDGVDFGNSTPIRSIDPISGRVVGTPFGSSGIGLSDTSSSFVTVQDFTHMRIDGVICTQAFIVCTSFQGQFGILTLAADGSLAYAWHSGATIYTVSDIIPAILGSKLFTAVPGDLITDGTESATCYVASDREIIRCCLTRAPTTSGGVSHWKGRTDKIWTCPDNLGIDWIFTDDTTGSVVPILIDVANQEVFFARIDLTDNIRGLSTPLLTGGGGLGSTLNATVAYTAGPIPNPYFTSFLAPPPANNFHSGWDKSTLGSTHTLGYHPLGANSATFTILNIPDGSFDTFDFTDWQREGVTASGVIQIAENHIWNGDGEYVIGQRLSAVSGDAFFGPAKIFPVIPPDEGIPLSTILEWLMLYAGFNADDISIDSNLTDTFTGSIIEEVNLDVWTMLSDMAKVFRFDVFESEGEIKITKFSTGASLTISVTLDTPNDLLCIQDAGDNEGKGNQGGDSPGSEPTNAHFTIERDWTTGVPQTIEMHYLDETQEYTVNIARSNKTTFPVQTTTNDNLLRVDVPMIMTPERALVYAAQALYDLYQGQVMHSFRLGQKYLRLEPGDVVALTLSGDDTQSYVLKLTEGTMNADWSMSCRGQGFANIDALGITGEEPLNTPQTVAGPSISQGFILDTPPLLSNDAENNDTLLRLYDVITSYGQNGWLGGAMLFSDAVGGPYTEVDVNSSTGGVSFGTTTAVLSGGLACTTDYISSLDVFFQVLGSTPASAGSFLIGDTGRWELVSYETVVASTGNSRQYTFSTLTRGLRGTEWWMGTHAAGDKVVMYPSDRIAAFTVDGTKADLTQWYRTVGVNLDPALVAARSFTMAENFEKPWAPTSLTATTISGGSSGITLSWMRRSRLETHLGDGAAMPLEPGWTEQYEIDILSGPSGSVLRTVTGALTNSYTYASGNVTTDFGSRPATISFNVYQISPVVGRGFAGSITTDVLSVT